jgi:hypothetical protein
MWQPFEDDNHVIMTSSEEQATQGRRQRPRSAHRELRASDPNYEEGQKYQSLPAALTIILSTMTATPSKAHQRGSKRYLQLKGKIK